MKAIILVRDVAYWVGLDFDTRSWANARRKRFKRRGVVKIIEQTSLH